MGTLKVTIAVGDSQGRQFEELDVTVDTGSTYTAVPRAMLNRMGDPGRKVATLRDCRRQHRPRRRRRSHHQAARTAVPHTGHICRGERTKPAGRSLPRAGCPCCRPRGGTTDTHQPATPLANSPSPRLKTAGHRSCFSDGSRTKTPAGQQPYAPAPEPLQARFQPKGTEHPRLSKRLSMAPPQEFGHFNRSLPSALWPEMGNRKVPT